jgi:hypothetical protein
MSSARCITHVGHDVVVSKPTVEDPGPLKLGILLKKPVSGPQQASGGHWRTRRIRLQPSSIEWVTLDDMPKGQLELTTQTQLRWCCPKSLCVTTNGRTLVLRAPDAHECSAWYAAIKNALRGVRKSALAAMDATSRRTKERTTGLH